MQIEKSAQGDCLELILRGRLDNDSSVYFRQEIEASASDGWHRILVDLSGVDYVSSSGIAALVDARQRLDRLSGLFGIHKASPDVEKILRLTGLFEKLRVDPRQFRARASSSGTIPRPVRERGLEMEIYSLCEAAPLHCRVFGQPESLFDAADSQRRLQTVNFGPRTLGLGLGVLSHKPDASPRDYYEAKHGEILAVAGAVAQSAHQGRGLPDYLVPAGDFVPSAQFRYGFQCEGELPDLIRFLPADAESPVSLSTIVACALKHAQARLAGIVILADCAALVGAQLRQLPAKVPADQLPSDADDRFSVPGIRGWLSFNTEAGPRHNLALIVGVAACEPLDSALPIAPLLRPMDGDGELMGHFHAAVFPHRPLKKRSLPLQSSVMELFESGSIEDVLHLLRDDRPITGSGESQLFGGACWIGSIGEISACEETA
jgi:anti-anti-sigma factor